MIDQVLVTLPTRGGIAWGGQIYNLLAVKCSLVYILFAKFFYKISKIQKHSFIGAEHPLAAPDRKMV